MTETGTRLSLKFTVYQSGDYQSGNQSISHISAAEAATTACRRAQKSRRVPVDGGTSRIVDTEEQRELYCTDY
jgi:hypothetical protein